MKLNELKCDLCDKSKNVPNGDSESSLSSTDHNSSTSTVGDCQNTSTDHTSSKQQIVIAKCLECNYFMCSACFADHQAISSFSNHQVVNLSSITINGKDDQDNENESDHQKKMTIDLQNQTHIKQNQLNVNQAQVSNLAQLQQQFNTLEDQLRIKNKHQQQQQQQSLIQSSQQLQQQRLLQIETEIQKSYNFYTQMLKERKDYLINELNTIVQYAVLNHSQNLNKQLKLKAELEQKRVNLELSESMQTFLSSDPSKVSPFNDMNNNKVNTEFAQLNNLTMINNQIINQLKVNNPLSQIEFVSNYSAIQTSIRNTFGYIRINNQMNALNNQQQVGGMNNNNNNKHTEIMNDPRNSNSASVYDYMTQMNKNQNRKGQGELHVDLDNFTGGQNTHQFSNDNQNFDNFTNSAPLSINTFSASSQSSIKSTNSSVITNSSSGSSFHKNQNNQQYIQKPIGSSHSCYDTSSTSPISITTDNLPGTAASSCFPSNSSNASSSAYFLDQWSNSGSNNVINDLITKSKTSGDLDSLSDDFFNSTMVKSKNSWSTNDTDKEVVAHMTRSKDNLFSPYFDNQSESNQQGQHSPSLTALLNSSKSITGNMSKFNNHAITLSAGSNKSTSSSHSGNTSQSYFQSKLQSNLANDDNMNMNSQKSQLMSATSSTSASPEDRVLSLSSSASSATSEIMKSSNSANMYNQTSANSANSASNLAVGSSTRSQLRRSKMIYHCKFGEFGINDGQFTEPSGVTINTNNDIIVADTNSHRIQIFDKDGRFKFKFGECGKRDGQLLYPNRVSVVKHTGDIVVTERSPTHQIQIYNKYGQFLRKFGANILQHPRGVCVDNKGRIIVVECKVMRVLIFDLMGNVLQKFNCSKYLEFPNGVCCSSGLEREEIYISDNRAHCIKVFDYCGNFIRQIGGEGITNYPIGVGINTNNEILVADNHNNFNLTVFSQDGTLINALESKVKHAQCFDVGLMDDGSIVLASKDYRIYVYKYVNNNLALSGNYTNENNQLVGNDQNGPSDFHFEQRDLGGHNDEQFYDLFSPQMGDLTNYNQLIGGMSNTSNQFSSNLNKSSENLLDNLNANTFNCLMSA